MRLKILSYYQYSLLQQKSVICLLVYHPLLVPLEAYISSLISLPLFENDFLTGVAYSSIRSFFSVFSLCKSDECRQPSALTQMVSYCQEKIDDACQIQPVLLIGGLDNIPKKTGYCSISSRNRSPPRNQPENSFFMIR